MSRPGTSPDPVSLAVIWLHGLGDCGSGWVDTMQDVARRLPGVKIVLPSAPDRPITINNGMLMPGWFDILG